MKKFFKCLSTVSIIKSNCDGILNISLKKYEEL